MVIPNLIFSGDCAEALSFYETVFETVRKMAIPYGDYVPEGLSDAPPNLQDWILHAEMAICGTDFWFADDPMARAAAGERVKLTAKVATAREARRMFDALCAGGRVTLPPTETFYSTFHAGLTDRFGVGWNIVAEESPAQA